MLDINSDAPSIFYRTPHHIYLRPARALAPYIAHYTITHPAQAAYAKPTAPMLTLMPDLGGCFVYSQDEGEWSRFWGAYTTAVQVNRDFDDAPVRFFVEFLPGGASRLLGAPMREYADAVAPAGLVHAELHKRIKEAVLSATTIGPLVARVDSLFLALLYKTDNHDAAAALLPLLPKLTSTKPVRELAEKTGYSERQLGRIFGGSVGVGVKTATRIVRLNRMLQFLQPGVSLTTLAQQAGYYDQAHLDHDFKAICGISPSEYLRAASDFYKEEFKF